MGRKRKNASRPAGSPSSDDLGVNVAVRNSANERERDRMRVLSKAFTRLKTTLPWVPPDTKLSKLDTLRLASSYIAHLARMLAEDAENNDSSVRRHVADTGSAVVDGNAPSVHPRKLVSSLRRIVFIPSNSTVIPSNSTVSSFQLYYINKYVNIN